MAEHNLQPEPTLEQNIVLEVRNVTKTFPGVIANADVDIKLRRGEILALLGENGAGKSTLMNIIYGLYHQDQGDIILNGRDVRFASPREAIRSGIGMVHQHFQLVDVMTVAENVILGEEKETPTWPSLFNMFFTFIFAVFMTVLAVAYNEPLVYTSITLAIVGLLLPWYVQRYVFTRIGFAVIGLAALAFGLDALDITYPEQFLFVDMMVVVGLLLVIYILMGLIPRSVFQWMDTHRRWLILGSQAFALTVLLVTGAEATTLQGTFTEYGNGFTNALQGKWSEEYEIVVGLIGMVLLGSAGYYIPRILSNKNPLQPRLESLASFDSIDKKVWFNGLALMLLGAVGLGVVAFIALLSIGILPDNNDLLRWREFMGLASLGLILTAVGASVLGYVATFAFNNWADVVGALRVGWGIAWRVGLIGVAIWAGGQARNISQMAIITYLLQTPVETEIFRDTPRTVDDATVAAYAQTEVKIEPSWRTIDREPSRVAQINALVAEIDRNFYDAETGQYRGISRQWRNAVDDVPPLVNDVTIGFLLIAFGTLSVRTWRGTKLLPGALGGISLAIMGLLVLIFAAAIVYLLDEVSLIAEAGFLLAGLGAMIAIFYITYQDRQRDPTRIRSITPVDTVIDAIADLLYTIFSVRRTREAAERVRELSKQHGLEVDPYAVIEKLPVGLQQRVEIIKALYRKADILILDEPTAVLTPQEGEELFKIMRELSSQGVSIIFITHKLKEVFKVATNIVVMRGGRVVGTTTPSEATEASLAAMMVGREVLLRVEKDDAHPDASILSVENLHATDDRGAKALAGLSFEVRAGEVLGIAGVQGNGQSELVEVLTGLRPMEAGAVELLGQELKPQRYADANIFRRGLAVLMDFVFVATLAAFFSYFWSYFSVGVQDFKVLSTQTLIIFLVLDPVYTLGSWLLPILLRQASPVTQNTTLDLTEQVQTATRNNAGQTLGKLVMNLYITQQNDLTPSLLGLVIRYIGQTASRYLLPLYMLLTAIYAVLSGGEGSLASKWNRHIQHAWYDRLPLVNGRVSFHAGITPRKIKDLATSHVPEDRLRFGMVKPFSVAENLILNDYYEAPHAQSPSVIQLPFVTAVYGVIFGGIFAVLGYIWLYFWNNSLWTALLDGYGVPDSPQLRTVPTELAMNAAQRNNLNDPLLVSLVTLVVMVVVFSFLSYVLMRLVLRYLLNPLSIVPPLVFLGLVYLSLGAIDRVLVAADFQAFWLPFMGLLNTLFNNSTSFSPEANQIIVYSGGLVLVLLAGLVYDQIRPQVVQLTESQLSTNPIGQSLLAYNQRGVGLNIKNEALHSNRLIEQYDIRTPSAFTTGSALSGGNQQKVVVAREFSRQPRLLIASQPTRGIDVGSIEFIHKQIISQRDQGAAVLLVSAELDEVMSLSDRIAVMYKGQIIKVIDAKAATREELGLLMAGIVRD